MDFIITEKNATICLNMIVKNEAHIIENTLEKLCAKIKFDYWVICDTGSTDDTPKIITAFFEKKGIKGELFFDEWVNFAHNRTLALQRAYKKTNLLLVFDADDEIVGDLKIPTEVLFDEYHFQFGSAVGINYTRVLMINNYKQYEFLSVIHEFISCKEGPAKSAIMSGNYYVISGRTGNRSLDPDKYLKDALILEKAHGEALKTNNHLFHRYAFYCANSYKDCGKIEDAIKWYKITLGQEQQWAQEKYVSCLNIYDCYQKLGEQEKGFFYLVKAFAYDTERVECLFPLLVHYCCANMNRVAYNYYLNIKDFYENRYLNTNISNKLFTIQDKYDFFVPYYMILIADKVQDFECVVKMYEIVFTKKQRMFDEWYVRNFLYNLQFFLKHVPKHNTKFIVLANEYIKFVYENGVKLHNFDFWLKPEYKNAGLELDNFLITEVTNKTQKFSKDECACSKNILIYTGFSDIEWNYTYIQKNALGGSEKAVSYISQCFPKDYTIYISGHVKNETIGNIQYIHLNELTKLMEITPFHTVIVSRYISFYEMFKECSFYQSFIWAHDILLLPYGSSLNDTQILEKWNKYINGCICLTEWHKNVFIERYPILKDKITLINNGLDLKSFSIKDSDNNNNNNNNNNNTESKHTNKIKNKFIYSSRPDRGLNVLLNLWPKILENFPDATLVVSLYVTFPSNPEDIILKNIIDANDSIKFLGKLNADQLYLEMASSEYWLYPTHWPETSCITALEMLMSEVICLYYPVAGLTNTMGNYGIQVQSGKEIDTLVSLTDFKKETLRKNGREYAETCSWSNRCEKWNKLLSLNQIIDTKLSCIYENNFIKIINLERRKDRLDSMTNNLKRLNIDHYEIIKAVDGKILKPTTYIKKLFKGNDFFYIKGVIGCALSHYNLWKRLLNDDNNNYYCIFEDDITFVDNFKEKLEKVLSIFDGDFCLIGGGSMNVPNINISKLNIIERTEKIVDCLFGYIVTKNGAKKMIEYINANSIHVPIDHIYPKSFDSICVVNEYLVKSYSWQLNGNRDTDIQLDVDSFSFTNPIKIAYADWWVFEYCGGNFDYENNFFTDLLSEYYNIQVVNPEDNPDILFYSVFGDNHKRVTAKRKIFFSGESISQRDDADFNITFDNNSDKNCRLPLWLCYLNEELIKDNEKKQLGIFNIPKKTKFSSIICQIDNKTGERGIIIEKLSKYKSVDCGGAFMNNIGYIVPRGINCSGKIEHNNSYKFCIAFENTTYPGYVTEKICDAYKSRCIPIYWGTKDVIKDFNPKTFINANDFTNFDDLVEYIIKVDTDDTLYESYFKYPILSEYWLDIINDPNKDFYKKLATNIVESNVDINPKKQWIFLTHNHFKYEVIEDYLKSYKKIANFIFVNDIKNIPINSDKIFVNNNLFEETIIEKTMFDTYHYSEICILITEPLNYTVHLELILRTHKIFPCMKVCTYSKSNIQILNNNNIHNTDLLPYYYDQDEIDYLQNLNKNTKEYDFGIICYCHDIRESVRKQRVVNFLKKSGFKVLTITGWRQHRDEQISKCKIMLNIHSSIVNTSEEHCEIFEHIRCDRLLNAGINIISEESMFLDDEFINKYPNLKNLKFDEILNIETYINLDWLN